MIYAAFLVQARQADLRREADEAGRPGSLASRLRRSRSGRSVPRVPHPRLEPPRRVWFRGWITSTSRQRSVAEQGLRGRRLPRSRWTA